MKKNQNLSGCLKLASLFLIFLIASCQKKSIEKSSSMHETTKTGDAIFHTFHIDGNTTIIKELNGIYYFSDDEILSQRQFDILKQLNNKTASPKTNSTVTTEFVKKWPNATVYYTISTSAKESIIRQAMTYISDRSNITFVARNGQSNYIDFVDGNSNASNSIGMAGGRQQIELYNNIMGIAAHEILHAIGVFHEQSRADRDSYVDIKWSNIQSDKVYNFNIAPNSTAIGNFDFNSIMMYGSDAFAINPSLPTITTKSGGSIYEQRDRLTPDDVLGIAYLYGSLLQGNANLCVSAGYSLTKIPAGAIISWTATPSGVVSITNANTINPTVTKVSDGPVELKATVSTYWDSYSFAKNLQAGTPAVTGTFVTTGYSGALNPTRSSLWTVGSGGYYSGTVNLDTNLGDVVTWTLLSKSTPTTFVNIYNNTVTISPSGHSAVIRITRANSCGSTYKDCTFIANGTINRP